MLCSVRFTNHKDASNFFYTMSRRDFNGTNGPIRFKESLRFDDKFSQLYQRTDHHGVFPGRDILYQSTEQEVSSIESYGIVVYQRKFTFYVMHRTNGGLHVVDVLTEFSIPSTKDQLYVLKEVIESVYLFKSQIIEDCSLYKTHVGVSESPVDASPSKASRTHDALTNSELIFL
ncbi:hypothetical protein RhiirA4_546430 [Rhizophagus irregularis]|uniref:Uncharacterized protein n=1 Tax=Rhizophagus irregularis TaxID=588596 RepID=A0A2I1GX60_9GLOM|nr:hypothetical protein RhiirA4_546430 [Rhizophagus irregularis]